MYRYKKMCLVLKCILDFGYYGLICFVCYNDGRELEITVDFNKQRPKLTILMEMIEALLVESVLYSFLSISS